LGSILELDRSIAQAVDDDPADVAWSRVAAVLAINRLCTGSELAVGTLILDICRTSQIANDR